MDSMAASPEPIRNQAPGNGMVGVTVVITSHVLPELEELADDILFLADGVSRWHGAVLQLKASTGQSSLERAVASLLAGRARMAVA